MTIVTRVTLKDGAAPEWDAAMRDRLSAARGQAGWISGQLLIPVDRLNERAIVGTWQTRAHWEAWHHDEAFAETRVRLAGLEVKAHEEHWYEVIEDVRQPVSGLDTGRVAA